MSRFVQSLESRTLFAATPTKATFITDELHIFADAATTRADLKAAAAVIAADTKTIAADLKSLSTASNKASNAALLKTLKVDEVKALVTLRVDEAVLLGPATGLSRRSAAHGIALLLHPTNVHLQALVAADEAALAIVTTAPLAKLKVDTQNVGIGTDLTNIANANPSSTLLATHIQNFGNDGMTAVTNFVTAAMKFTTDVGTLAADLGATPTTGTTIPNLVGTFNGSATATAGTHVGRVSTLVVHITTEGANGSLTGSITITNPGSSPMTQTLTGMVTANGTFTATVTDSSGNGATLSGTAVGKTISGTYASTGGSSDSGTFKVTMA